MEESRKLRKKNDICVWVPAPVFVEKLKEQTGKRLKIREFGMEILRAKVEGVTSGLVKLRTRDNITTIPVSVMNSCAPKTDTCW